MARGRGKAPLNGGTPEVRLPPRIELLLRGLRVRLAREDRGASGGSSGRTPVCAASAADAAARPGCLRPRQG
eukprot:7787987-Alexandrium_andersonii.AAC.1